MTFGADGPDATWVYAAITLPLTGWRHHAARRVGLALARLIDRTLAEVKLALEIDGYRAARAIVGAA